MIPLVDFSQDSDQESDAPLIDDFISLGLGQYLFEDALGMSSFPSHPMGDSSCLDLLSHPVHMVNSIYDDVNTIEDGEVILEYPSYDHFESIHHASQEGFDPTMDHLALVSEASDLPPIQDHFKEGDAMLIKPSIDIQSNVVFQF